MRYLSIIFSLIFVVACSSIPDKKSEDMALLAINIELSNDINKVPFRHYQLFFSGVEKPIVVRPSSSKTLFSTTIPIGSYRIEKLVSVHKDRVRKREFKLNIPVSLEAGKVTILSEKLNVTMYRKPSDPNTSYQDWKFVHLSKSELLAIKEQIRAKNDKAGWEL